MEYVHEIRMTTSTTSQVS